MAKSFRVLCLTSHAEPGCSPGKPLKADPKKNEEEELTMKYQKCPAFNPMWWMWRKASRPNLYRVPVGWKGLALWRVFSNPWMWWGHVPTSCQLTQDRCLWLYRWMVTAEGLLAKLAKPRRRFNNSSLVFFRFSSSIRLAAVQARGGAYIYSSYKICRKI